MVCINTNDISDFSLERGTGTMEILVAFMSKFVNSEPIQCVLKCGFGLDLINIWISKGNFRVIS